ncbi:MAG: TonB-dependent receptor [Chlorobiota bacterium]|nr:TonB-dependent receptor [Chlorobiota bacterium]QQS66760.1 MAG: TonB-dependent receptor [Chlorobiota bacterium]
MRFHIENIYFLLICLLTFSVPILLKSQETDKGIYLVNINSKIPLQDVSVKSNDNSFNTISDENGFIDLKNLSVLSKNLIISCVGFQSINIEITKLTFINKSSIIYLTPKVTSIQEVNVVVSANKGIFKTISDLDIHLRRINNSQEVLRMVPGLFIGQHAGGGKAEQIFLRGFDIDHGTDINISVDGMPVNMPSHAHGQGYADLHFVIPEIIDNVNFNKGPYYADKGNFTTAGFVEFKTKDYLESNFVKTEGGQFNTFRGIAGINILKPEGQKRDQSLYFAGEGSFTKGYFESPQDFSRFNGLLKYHGNINNQNTLNATLTGFKSNWHASGQIPDRAVENGSVGFYGAIDNTEGGSTSRHNLNIALQSRFSDGGLLNNQLYYSKYNFELYSNFTFYKEDRINGDQIRQKESRNIIGYNGFYQKDSYIGKLITETKAGVQIRYDIVDDIELTRTKNRIVNTKEIMIGIVNELNAAAYLSQNISLSDNFDITGALRFDYYNNQYNDKLISQGLTSNSTIISPKLNFNYRANDNVQLYLYNGKGFHSNDTRVAVQQNGKKVLPPAYGTDLGGIFKIGDNLIVQSALWYLWLDQEFVYVGDEGIVEPGGQSQRLGFDLSARFEVVKNLFVDVDLSLANPKSVGVVASESYLPLAPCFTSVGGLTYRNEKGLNGSLRYRFMDSRPANEDNTIIAEGYFIIDAAINYNTSNWEAGLSIQNLLNTKWKETQFDTESQLQSESAPISEIHFTPGTPFFGRLSFTMFF